MNSGPKADGPQVSLRKALEVVKKAAQAHVDAIKTAEVAFSSALAELAQGQRKLKQEREAFERERAELGGPGGEEPQFQEDEEVPEPPLDGDEEAQQMQHDSAEEEPPLHDDEDGGEGPEGGPGWKGKGRAMDRSRSRDRRGKGGAAFLPRPVLVAPPPAAAPAQLVLQAIDRLRLDENATRAIKMFPPDQALDLLGQVGENVRNPSAFVTTMCNRTMQEGPGGGGPRPPSEFERLEAAIVDMGLDESATRVLHELPPDAALNLLTQVDGGVRNASAFVMSLAHRALKSGGSGPWQGPSLPELVEQNIMRLRLDESATRMLHDLAPEHAMDIMDQIGEDVRNPSAFVTAEVRKVMHVGGGPRPYDQGPPRGASNPRDLSQQVASLAKALDLDSDCLDAAAEHQHPGGRDDPGAARQHCVQHPEPLRVRLRRGKEEKAGGPAGASSSSGSAWPNQNGSLQVLGRGPLQERLRVPLCPRLSSGAGEGAARAVGRWAGA
eukprot:CAMPEP_0171255396 /NCGR_PEP_ID=MMETSP0790-20130122/52749_1 /TAXON_ID=2925 /ORGANISM="Alexandrium catenella, Strain OF101" /LENGTH=495 /DNA_ID=CAMNT_0011723355 /DNA_START=72 /DNA_END=1555 /DNA_ORIENTATION=+